MNLIKIYKKHDTITSYTRAVWISFLLVICIFGISAAYAQDTLPTQNNPQKGFIFPSRKTDNTPSVEQTELLEQPNPPLALGYIHGINFVGYDETDNIYRLGVLIDKNTTVVYSLTEAQIDDFSNAINKYTEWSAMAVENNENVEKDIATIENIPAFFQVNETIYEIEGVNTITFSFTSMYKAENPVLVISFSALKAKGKNTLSVEPQTLSFVQSDVADVLTVLSQETLQEKRQEKADKDAIPDKYI